MLVIVQGHFRSGTTAVFESLRQDKALTCYYEPLHPELLHRLRDLEEMAEGRRPTTPKAGLFQEFAAISQNIREHFDATFAFEHSVMGAGDKADQLATYLRMLSASAQNVLLQFNRASWLSGWLGNVFPGSHFIHIVRDPRSVVWSVIRHRRGVQLDLPCLRSVPIPIDRLVFSRFARARYYFEDYLRIGMQEFPEVFAQVHRAEPFVQALALWAHQVTTCQSQAREAFGARYFEVRYEDFCAEPVRTVAGIYNALGQQLPASVEAHLSSSIHKHSLHRWASSRGAARRFRAGLRRAGAADAARSFGYE